MSLGDTRCPWCGAWNPIQPHFCTLTPNTAAPYPYPNTNPAPPSIHEYGRNPLTADEVRKIVREEIERALPVKQSPENAALDELVKLSEDMGGYES